MKKQIFLITLVFLILVSITIVQGVFISESKTVEKNKFTQTELNKIVKKANKIDDTKLIKKQNKYITVRSINYLNTKVTINCSDTEYDSVLDILNNLVSNMDYAEWKYMDITYDSSVLIDIKKDYEYKKAQGYLYIEDNKNDEFVNNLIELGLNVEYKTKTISKTTDYIQSLQYIMNLHNLIKESKRDLSQLDINDKGKYKVAKDIIEYYRKMSMISSHVDYILNDEKSEMTIIVSTKKV